MVLTRFHLYVGVDYTAGSLGNASSRRRFSPDAEQVSDLLNHPQTEKRLLTGPVRSTSLITELRNAIGPEKQERDILIYFAGHAVREGNDVFLMMADAESGNPGVDVNWLLRLINEAKYPRRIAVILDCCYSSCPGPLQRNRYWLAATGPEAVSTDDFHSTLVACLAYGDSRPLTLQSLHSCLIEKCVFSQPELSGTFAAPYDLRGQLSISERSPIDAVKSAVDITLVQRGRLRTAFPTDLCFAELFEEGLFIEPQIHQVRTNNTLPQINMSRLDLLSKVAGGASVLVLGEPGAGKSFLSYLCQKELVAHYNGAITVDLDDLIRASSGPSGDDQPDYSKALKQILGPFKQSGESFELAHEGVLIIDSLDEAISEDVDKGHVGAVFDRLARRCRVLAFCRRQEYDNNLFTVIRSRNFDHIVGIEDWRPTVEFAAYIELLIQHGYEWLDALVNLVNKDFELQQQVKRPLHARMLAFVWNHHGDQKTFDTPDSLAVLYSRYLDDFAKICEERIKVGSASSEAPSSEEIRALWRRFAWIVFSKELLASGGLSASSFSGLLASLTRLEQRATRAILQEHLRNRRQLWNYIHYSFHEYLVAEAFVLQILDAYHNGNHQEAMQLVRRDMTKDIRRFAVRILRRTPQAMEPRFSSFLANTYHKLRSAEVVTEEALIACNLIIYMLGRINNVDSVAMLRMLLSTEETPFLRTSLYWSACYSNDATICAEYCETLSNDPLMQKLNRGYLMYYLERTGRMPYSDDDA